MSECLVRVGDRLGVDVAGRTPVGQLLPVGAGEYPLATPELTQLMLPMVLVRPDGYVGLVADPTDTGELAGYLRSL